MVFGQFSSGLTLACVLGLFSVSCITKKNEPVAVEAADPPPAAYPEGPSAYGDQANSTPPPATAAAPTAPSVPAFKLREGEQLVDHQIKSGENLSVIASKYNTSVRRIQAANGMSNSKIYAGKTLKVPTSAPPNLAMSSQAPAPPTGGRYGSTGYSAQTAPAPAPSSSTQGRYPSTTTTPTAPSYPATTAPTERVAPPPIQVPSSPSSTSYPPQTPSQQPGSFPTPSFGGGGIQFSD